MLTSASLKHPMTEAEYQARYVRSQALHGTQIRLSVVATLIGAFSMAWLPLALIAVVLLCASLLVGRRADRVSPFKGS